MNYYYENLAMEEAIPARIYIRKSSSDDCHYPLHWHRDLEFDLVLEGNIIAKLNGEYEPVTIDAGEFFFVNSGELHETDAINYHQLNTVTVILSYQMLKEYCKDIDSYYFEFEGLDHAKQRIKELIVECARVYEEKNDFYELDLAILIRKMCSILLKECRMKKQNNVREQKNLISIKRAMAYMEENYVDDITLVQISNEIGMADTYFSRYFKKMTGQTFHSYLTKVRLYHAYRQLQEQDTTITQIALDNGFANVKSFIEAFKKVYQVTPDRYRHQEKDNF